MHPDWKTKTNTAPFLVSFSKYSAIGTVIYILKIERKHVSKQAQIFALFVQKLFFFLCGSGQVPIKVVFQASFPCSRAAASPPPLFWEHEESKRIADLKLTERLNMP